MESALVKTPLNRRRNEPALTRGAGLLEGLVNTVAVPACLAEAPSLCFTSEWSLIER